MKLPNASNAIIEQQKVVHYLLNAAHPDNGGKAAFFARLGFSAENWMLLAQAFSELALAYDCVSEVSSPSVASTLSKEYCVARSVKAE